MTAVALDNIDLNLNQLLNARAQNLAADPGSPGTGQVWFNTTTSQLKFYDGSAAQIVADLTGIAGISSRGEVAYATAAALPANTYANGTAGVGATLTANAMAALSVDGVAVVAGQRILVKNEAAAANNGIYTVTNAGSGAAFYVLTRAVDADVASELGPGLLVPVEAPSGSTGGTVNNQQVWLSLGASPFVVGTSSLTFVMVGGTYSAGTGITFTGTVIGLTVPVAIANGGTNAITASGARASLNVPQMFTSAAFGDGVTTSFAITHSLNNANPIVQVVRVSDGATILCGTSRNSVNQVTVTFGTAPATNSMVVVAYG